MQRQTRSSVDRLGDLVDSSMFPESWQGYAQGELGATGVLAGPVR